MKNYILIFITQITLFIGFGQNVKELKKPHKYDEGTLIIIAKLIDSSKNINIFLINKTLNKINVFGGYDSKIIFNKEIKDTNGIWKNFDPIWKYAYSCGTGLESIDIPINNYTYEIYKKNEYFGDLSTELRFYFRVSDSNIIYSKPIKVSVNSDLLLNHHERFVKNFKDWSEENENSNLELSEKENIISRMISAHNTENEYLESLKICQKWLKVHPNLYKVRFLYGRTILLCLTKEFSKAEINILISNAILELRKVPINEKYISSKSKEIIKKYSNLLLTQEEWLTIKDKKSINVNDSIYKTIFDENIKVLYKE